MTFVFSDEAVADLVEIYRFLGPQGKIRKRRFSAELRQCLRDIVQSPELWPEVFSGIRLKAMKRFGFGIYYRASDPFVKIGAIIHLKRRPHSARERFS